MVSECLGTASCCFLRPCCHKWATCIPVLKAWPLCCGKTVHALNFGDLCVSLSLLICGLLWINAQTFPYSSCIPSSKNNSLMDRSFSSEIAVVIQWKSGAGMQGALGTAGLCLLQTLSFCWHELAFGAGASMQNILYHQVSYLCAGLEREECCMAKVCQFSILAASAFGLKSRWISTKLRIVFVFWQYIKIEDSERDVGFPCLSNNTDPKKKGLSLLVTEDCYIDRAETEKLNII